MKIQLISLGCDKNLSDSEKVLARFAERGYEITDDEHEADAIVINTCCFIHDAKTESIETILEMAELKKENLKFLVITGCLATRYQNEIQEEIPEVDAILTASAIDETVDVVDALFANKLTEKKIKKDVDYDPELGNKRVFSGMKNYAYLKIAEGCDKHCTYCVIPSIKGKYRSRAFEDILEEAQFIADSGKNEILIIAQETTVYGQDIYGRKRLAELLEKISEIDGIRWIRLLYCYPEEITDELIDAMSRIDKVCKYIDMPIQHSADTVLKRMGRRTSSKDIRDVIGRLRAAMPEIAIRTSLITGFPGETEEEHAELLAFVKEMKLDRVGVFTYSKEEKTPASRMRPLITKKIKEARREELMLAQQEIVFAKNESLVGHRENVIIEGYLPEDGVYIGRTFRDAPDIDGYCFVKSGRELISGDIIEAVIEAANGYDLLAKDVYLL
ncbi:MAG: 30S ribosomal protein S12 methylthiotransferase RimO [Lachnospiraceae bacterium]|nr:30S ribosomal protein S12 methylthiotransferase RimO [Lachnospiraceae bacterium]